MATVGDVTRRRDALNQALATTALTAGLTFGTATVEGKTAQRTATGRIPLSLSRPVEMWATSAIERFLAHIVRPALPQPRGRGHGGGC